MGKDRRCTLRHTAGVRASTAIGTYGGWGNDLLNADDNLTTNGGLNDTTDTSTYYNDIAFGGAGPVHAYSVARKLGLKRLVVPRAAGVASALGLLIAPARVDRLADGVRDLLAELYPEDQALGYEDGDLRGAISVTVLLD